MEETVSYMLRGIPKALWREVRHRATNDDTTIKQIVIRSFLTYLGLDDTDLGRSQAEINKPDALAKEMDSRD